MPLGCPEKSAYFPRSGYYDRLDFSCTYVDLHICDTAETPSAAYIDHFFFLQFTDPHTASPPFYALLNLLYERTVPPWKQKLYDKFAELFGATDDAHFYFAPGGYCLSRGLASSGSVRQPEWRELSD